ncbi:hypothetical protein SGLAM104S_01972 [Streptomyces glaucescens]
MDGARSGRAAGAPTAHGTHGTGAGRTGESAYTRRAGPAVACGSDDYGRYGGPMPSSERSEFRIPAIDGVGWGGGGAVPGYVVGLGRTAVSTPPRLGSRALSTSPATPRTVDSCRPPSRRRLPRPGGAPVEWTAVDTSGKAPAARSRSCGGDYRRTPPPRTSPPASTAGRDRNRYAVEFCGLSYPEVKDLERAPAGVRRPARRQPVVRGPTAQGYRPVAACLLAVGYPHAGPGLPRTAGLQPRGGRPVAPGSGVHRLRGDLHRPGEGLRGPPGPIRPDDSRVRGGTSGSAAHPDHRSSLASRYFVAPWAKPL